MMRNDLGFRVETVREEVSKNEEHEESVLKEKLYEEMELGNQ